MFLLFFLVPLLVNMCLVVSLRFPLGRDRRIFQQVTINTVDGYQGQELDIVIMSCARADSSQRLNVALTRAKESLFICGHLHGLQCTPLWRDLIADAAEHQIINHVSSSCHVSTVERLIKK